MQEIKDVCEIKYAVFLYHLNFSRELMELNAIASAPAKMVEHVIM